MITNDDAGTADEEALKAALEILRKHCSVDLQATSNPGELDGLMDETAYRDWVKTL